MNEAQPSKITGVAHTILSVSDFKMSRPFLRMADFFCLRWHHSSVQVRVLNILVVYPALITSHIPCALICLALVSLRVCHCILLGSPGPALQAAPLHRHHLQPCGAGLGQALGRPHGGFCSDYLGFKNCFL